MTRPLPVRPNLAQLRRQAKDIVKAHRRGEVNVCRVISHLPRFRGKSVDRILSASLCLGDAQHALAMTARRPG